MSIAPNRMATKRGEKVLRPKYMANGYNTAPHTSVMWVTFLGMEVILSAMTKG
jgi:hypothetical protein